MFMEHKKFIEAEYKVCGGGVKKNQERQINVQIMNYLEWFAQEFEFYQMKGTDVDL